MNAIIIHGLYGFPEENWFSWLKNNLEKIGIKTIIPAFPDSENPKLHEWLDFFESYKTQINEKTILIGHSLGVSFILNFLNNNEIRIKSAYLVGGFLDLSNHFEKIIESFIKTNLDFKKIKNSSENFFIYNSDNDPYVPIEKGKELSLKLGSELKLITGAGHFNTSSGYDEFDLLFEDIKKEIYKTE